MSEFDEYIRQGDPGRSEKAAAWQTAIGLQDVDGFKPSKYPSLVHLKVQNPMIQRANLTL